MRRGPFLAAALAVLGFMPGAASAQANASKVVIDRVVAVVGNRPILQSQVDEQFFVMLTQQGAPKLATAQDTAGLRRQIVNDLIDTELLVQEAQRDTTIKVTDQEVADGVEQYMKNLRQRFTNDAEYRTELHRSGFQSPEEYRRWLGDEQRREFLRNRLIDKRKSEGKLKSVPPTDKEMRDYFDTQKGRLGKRPSSVIYRQVVITPKPSQAAKDSVLKLADSIVTELRKGGDFASAAKRFSQDPGSKELGGSLGWSRRGGGWVPQFEAMAFALKPGVVSDPVLTPFGYHIIQVERVQPAEVSVRHILLVPQITPDSIAAAKALAETVRQDLVAGASIDSLQKKYHDPSEVRQSAETQIDRLTDPYKGMLENAKTGDIMPVTSIEVGPTTKYLVVQVLERRDEGEVRYEDVKDRVRSQLGEQLGIRRYMDRLRTGTYIEIRQV